MAVLSHIWGLDLDPANLYRYAKLLLAVYTFNNINDCAVHHTSKFHPTLVQTDQSK